uniref:Uncharacterized protein n=1 Tax=Rhipicephalus appendiculatus TaxID=34631 RepID=A0A131YD81_RHIAP
MQFVQVEHKLIGGEMNEAVLCRIVAHHCVRLSRLKSANRQNNLLFPQSRQVCIPSSNDAVFNSMNTAHYTRSVCDILLLVFLSFISECSSTRFNPALLMYQITRRVLLHAERKVVFAELCEPE